MATKTKADQAFEAKRKSALNLRDFDMLEKSFNQYGHYLELIGGEPESQPPTEYVIAFDKTNGRVTATAKRAHSKDRIINARGGSNGH